MQLNLGVQWPCTYQFKARLMEIQCLEKSGDGLGTRSRNHGKRLRDGRFYGIPRIEGKEKAQKKEKVNASVDKSSGKRNRYTITQQGKWREHT